jgi:hypothetical protein
MNFYARGGVAVPELVDFNGHSLEAEIPPLDWLAAGERRSVASGIKALMQAVLEDGVRSYLARDKRLRAEAEWWIASGSRRSPFAFTIVCETLGLEPGAVRVAVRRLRENNLPARQILGRTRPNGRRPGRLVVSRGN